MVTDYDKHLKNVKPEDTECKTWRYNWNMSIVIIPHTKNSKKIEKKNNGNFKSIQVCIKISGTVDILELSLCKQMYCHN